MSRFQASAKILADYFLSQGHELENYLRECREANENPLEIEEHIDSNFSCAIFVKYDGDFDKWRREIFYSGDISLREKLLFFIRDSKRKCRHPEEEQDFRDDLLDLEAWSLNSREEEQSSPKILGFSTSSKEREVFSVVNYEQDLSLIIRGEIPHPYRSRIFQDSSDVIEGEVALITRMEN